MAGESVQAWAQGDPALAAMLAAGTPVVGAVLRWGTELLRAGRGGRCRRRRSRSRRRWGRERVRRLDEPRGGAGADGRRRGVGRLSERSVAIEGKQPDAWLLLGMGRGEARATRGGRAGDAGLGGARAIGCRVEVPGGGASEAGGCAGSHRGLPGALALGPADAAVSAMLGKLLYEEGHLLESAAAYETALQLEPGNAHFARMASRTRFLRDVIQGATVDEAITDLRGVVDRGAHRAVRGGIRRSRRLRAPRGGAASGPEAGRAVAPERGARYLLASLRASSPRALSGRLHRRGVRPLRGPVRGAAGRGVGYDVPEKLGALVRDLVPRVLDDALDAGCGTGLCAGPGCVSSPAACTGLDVWPKMLDQARSEAFYDALDRRGKLDRLLTAVARGVRSHRGRPTCSLLGDLGPLFEATARRCPRGAVRGELRGRRRRRERRPWYTLRLSGRFADAPVQVDGVAAPAARRVALRATTLRREGRQRVAGHLLVLRTADVDAA